MGRPHTPVETQVQDARSGQSTIQPCECLALIKIIYILKISLEKYV